MSTQQQSVGKADPVSGSPKGDSIAQRNKGTGDGRKLSESKLALDEYQLIYSMLLAAAVSLLGFLVTLGHLKSVYRPPANDRQATEASQTQKKGDQPRKDVGETKKKSAGETKRGLDQTNKDSDSVDSIQESSLKQEITKELQDVTREIKDITRDLDNPPARHESVESTQVWLAFHLVFAAALGASFYVLFTAHRYVVRRTFNPEYSSVYMIRFGLGVVAGVILASIFDPETIMRNQTSLSSVGPGVIAILGGYAAEAVQLVLRRLVDVLLTVVQGDTRSQIEASEEKKDAEKQAALVAQGANVVKKLAALRGELKGNVKAEDIQAKLDAIEKTLLAETSTSGTGSGAGRPVD
ncbi:MAG: hypothetical protein HZA46_08455 [Planctomycetales bacterium]|nr:hypothetical protein [Planctomycetales bacterium]